MDPTKILVVGEHANVADAVASQAGQLFDPEPDAQAVANVKMEAMRRVLDRLPKKIKRAMRGKETCYQMMERLAQLKVVNTETMEPLK